jgi:hypothetical protein
VGVRTRWALRGVCTGRIAGHLSHVGCALGRSDGRDVHDSRWTASRDGAAILHPAGRGFVHTALTSSVGWFR